MLETNLNLHGTYFNSNSSKKENNLETAAKVSQRYHLLKIPKKLIKINFDTLIDVFLQVDRFENDKTISFAGKVTIIVAKGRGSFTNHPKAVLDVPGDFVVRAHKIKNRGYLKTDSIMKLEACQVDNSSGRIISKSGTNVKSNMFQNVGGKVIAEEGPFIWTSGPDAFWDNSKGILRAGKDVITALSDDMSSKNIGIQGRSLINKSGTITARNSQLFLELNRIDNYQGRIRGNELDLRVDNFSNLEGQLLVVQEGCISIVDSFDNDNGLVDVRGFLTASNGSWSNRSGRIRAGMGFEAEIKKLDNTKGMVFSPKGPVRINSKHEIFQQGEIDAAEEIMLLSEQGVIWAQDGKIITPKSKILVHAASQHVDLSRAVIKGGELEVYGYKQIHLPMATVGTDGKITFRTEQGWIDAQKTELISKHSDLSFQAAKGSLYLEDNVTQLGGSLEVDVNQASVENSRLDISEDVNFHGERFKSHKSTFNIVHGHMTLNGDKSINLGHGEILVQRGHLTEKSKDGWIYEHDEKASARAIQRLSPEIFLTKVVDEAEMIVCLAENAFLNQYTADASESITFTATRSLALRKSNVDSPDIGVKSELVWLETVTARFEKMEVKATKGDLSGIDVKGEDFAALSKELLEIRQSKVVVKKIRLKGKQKLSLTKNEVKAGSVVATSDGTQQIANNTFSEGDFKLRNRKGDVNLYENTFIDMGVVDISTVKGETTVSKLVADVEAFSIKAHQLNMRHGKVRTEKKLKLDAKVSKIEHTYLEGNSTSIKGTEELNIENSYVKSETVGEYSSENSTFLYRSQLESNFEMFLDSNKALILESKILSTSSNAEVNFHENGVVIGSALVAKEKIELSANQSYWNESGISGHNVDVIQGSHVFAKSQVSSGHHLEMSGESVLFDHSKVSSKDDLLMHPQKLYLRESFVQGGSVVQDSDIILSDNTHTEAEDIERKAETLLTTGGSDQATTIHENATQRLLHSNYGAIADAIESTSKNLTYYHAQVKSDVKLDGELVNINYSIVEGSLTAKATQELTSYGTGVRGDLANLQSSNKMTVAQLSVDTVNPININGNVTSLKDTHLKTQATITVHSNSLDAPNLTLVSEGPTQVSGGKLSLPSLQISSNNSAQLSATSTLYIPRSKLRVTSSLHLSGEEIDRNAGYIWANSLNESGWRSISAQKSQTAITTTLSQTSSGGDIHLEGSQSYANNIYRQALRGIDHRNATSTAHSHSLTAAHFDNSKGTVNGVVSAQISVFDNRSGILNLDGGQSQVTVGSILSDNFSKIMGSGSLKILSEYGYYLMGKVYLGGTFNVIAPSHTILGSTQAFGVCFDATNGSIAVLEGGNVYGNYGEFKATENISNEKIMHFINRGNFSSQSLYNKGRIESKQELMIKQTNFVDPGNAFAKEHLILLSDSSVDFVRPRFLEGSLTVVSKNGFVNTNAEVLSMKDLTFVGTSFDINKSMHVGGRGTFFSPGDKPGDMNINGIPVTFGNGLDSNVNSIFLRPRSNLEVYGDSRINAVNNFVLNCEVIQPMVEINLWGGRSKKIVDTSQHYKVNSSSAVFHDNLQLNAKKVLNHASTFFVEGVLSYSGDSFDNINVDHIHSVKELTGTHQASCLGIKYGKKKNTYDWKHYTIIDAVANTQAGILNINLTGPVNNDGIIAAKIIEGTIGSMQNGIFTPTGRTPDAYSQTLKTMYPEIVFRPGGEFRSTESTNLNILGLLNNQGFVESEGLLRVRMDELMNKKRSTTQSVQTVKRGTFGSCKVQTHEDEREEHGGILLGSETILETYSGTNHGGSIQGEKMVLIEATEFTQKPLILNKVVHLKKSDNMMFYQVASGYSNRKGIISADITSGGPVNMRVINHFENVASDITGFLEVIIIAGSMTTKILFDTYQVVEKRTYRKSENLFNHTKHESHIRSIARNLLIISTDKNKDIILAGGEYGSMGGSARIQSAGYIKFLAESRYVENETSRVDFTPTSVTFTNRDYSGSITSLAHVIAGGGSVELVAAESIEGAGVQFTSAEKITANAKKISFEDHEVTYTEDTNAFKVGVEFFGSKAIDSAAAGKPLHHTLEALLREDPAIASALNLAEKVENKEGVFPIARGMLETAATSFNEAAKFSQAYNDGRLGNAAGEHFGITDSKGNFHPRVTLHMGSSSSDVTQVSSIPTRFHGEFIEMTATEFQRYKGCEFAVKGGGKFEAPEVYFEAGKEILEVEGGGFGAQIGVGPQGPSFGVNYGDNNYLATTYMNGNHDFGENLEIKADRLSIKGVELVADNVKAIIKKDTYIESFQDSANSHQLSASISTDGNFGFSEAGSKILQVNTIAGIKARKFGHFVGDSLELIGSILENIIVNVEHLKHQDLVNINDRYSFSTQGNFDKIGHAISGTSNEAFSILGGVDYSRSKQRGKTAASIVGGNGQEYAGINTDLNAVQQIGKAKKVEISVPFITFNPENFQRDCQSINQAFSSKAPSTPHTSPILPPERQKLNKKSESGDVSLALASMNIDLEEINGRRTAEEAAIKENKAATRQANRVAAHQNNKVATTQRQEPKVVDTTNKISDVSSYSVESENEAHYPVVEVISPHSYTNYNLLSEPLSESDHRRIETSAPRFPTIKEGSMHESNPWIEERNQQLEMMGVNEGLSDIFYLPLLFIDTVFEKGMDSLRELKEKFDHDAHYVCHSHPTIYKGCVSISQGTSNVYKNLKSKVIDWTPQWIKTDIPRWLDDRNKVLSERVNYNKEYLDIPKAMTEELHRTALSNILVVGSVLPLGKGISAGIKSFPKITSALKPISKVSKPVIVFQNFSIMNVQTTHKFAKVTTAQVTHVGSELDFALNKIYSTIENNSHKPLSTLIQESSEVISKGLTSYDGIHKATASEIQVYLKAAQKGKMEVSGDVTVKHFLKDKERGISVALISNGETSFIAKDSTSKAKIIHELIGLDLLQSLNLKHVNVPQPIGIGSRGNGKRLFIIKSYIEGEPIDKLMKVAGGTALKSELRQYRMEELAEVALKSGRALGEIQNKGIKTFQVPCGERLSKIVERFHDDLKNAENFLSQINPTLIINNRKKFLPAINSFNNNPGNLSFAFLDLHGGQFVWNPRSKMPLGYIDAESIPYSMTKMHKPLALVSEEYSEFMLIFESEGLLAGLNSQEIEILKKSFSRGYNLEYIGPRSASADHFFNISLKVSTIKDLAKVILESRNIKKELWEIRENILRNLLRNLDDKLETPAFTLNKYISNVKKSVKVKKGLYMIDKTALSIIPAGTKKSAKKMSEVKFLNKEKSSISKKSPIKAEGNVSNNLSPITQVVTGVEGNAEEVVKTIYASIENHPSRPLAFLTSDASEIISKNISSYNQTHNSKSKVDIWIEAVHKDRPIENKKFQVNYFKSNETVHVTLIRNGETFFVVKDSTYYDKIINELIGLNFLQSLKLKQMQISSPINIGVRSCAEEGKRYFVNKTFLPGKTIHDLMVKVGKTINNPTQRRIRINELLAVVEQSGKALGEFQNKGSTFSRIPSSKTVNDAIEKFHDGLEYASDSLSDIGKSSALGQSKKFRSVIEAFKKNPGCTTYGFDDLSGHQFIWNPKHKKPLGYTDAEFVPKSMTKKFKPLALSAEEYSNFMLIFESGGLIAGLHPKEVALLKNSFMKGYNFEYIGSRSQAADHFFDISSTVTKIQDIAEKYVNENKLLKGWGEHPEKLISTLLQDLDYKLKNPPLKINKTNLLDGNKLVKNKKAKNSIEEKITPILPVGIKEPVKKIDEIKFLNNEKASAKAIMPEKIPENKVFQSAWLETGEANGRIQYIEKAFEDILSITKMTGFVKPAKATVDTISDLNLIDFKNSSNKIKAIASYVGKSVAIEKTGNINRKNKIDYREDDSDDESNWYESDYPLEKVIKIGRKFLSEFTIRIPTSDGSMGPISKFVISPFNSISGWTKSSVRGVCQDNLSMSEICKIALKMLPTEVKDNRPHALILTAKSDRYGILNLDLVATSLFQYKKINALYQAKYIRVTSLQEICKAIDFEKANGTPPELLFIRAHGNPQSMSLDKGELFSIWDNLPKDSCFKNLSSKPTIVLDSCSNGEGKGKMQNIANFIARNSNADTTIFSATDGTNRISIVNETPLEIEFKPPLNTWAFFTGESITYKIDSENREEAIQNFLEPEEIFQKSTESDSYMGTGYGDDW